MPTLPHARVISWSRANSTAYKSSQSVKVTPCQPYHVQFVKNQPYHVQEWSVGQGYSMPTLPHTRVINWSRANPTVYKSGQLVKSQPYHIQEWSVGQGYTMPALPHTRAVSR